MAITVTSTEAKNNFGEMIRLAKNSKEGVVVKQYGDPTVVIVDYLRLKELQEDSQELQRQKALDELQILRERVAERNRLLFPNDSAEELYREAGFSEEAIRDMLETDKLIRERSR